MTKVAIIGAGITGLTLAYHLQKSDVDITIFDKSRGVSGRTSTRRAEPYHFDHGAPFFTAKSAEFKAFIQPMLEAGVLTEWQANVVEVSGTQRVKQYQWHVTDDAQDTSQTSHVIGTPKMNEMAKFMANSLLAEADINLRLATRVGQIEQTANNQWLLTSEDGDGAEKLAKQGNLGVFDWVVCTTPAEQARELVPTDMPFYARIAQSKMDGCFALMLGFDEGADKELEIDFDVALIKNSPLSCMTVNNRKPQRPQAFSLTVLSSNDWAEQHLEHDQEWVTAQLLKATCELLQVELTALQHQATHVGLHRWRYANSSVELEKNNADKPVYLLDVNQRFAVAGDWLSKSSVENAFISGSQLATQLMHQISC